ncbi:MAG: kelch repeat-containing protein, partial [Bacteroidetes bacterium]
MKKSIIIQSLSGLILLFFSFQGFAQWEESGLTPMPTPRFGSSAAVLDGKIYVIGGIDYDGTPTLRTVEIYEPTENTWSTGTDIPIPLYRPGCVVYSGKIFIFGGVDPEGKSDKVFEFDPQNPDTWVEKAAMPTPINWHQAQVVQDSIYIFGGINDTWVDSTLVYLPKTDNWVIREAMPQPRGFYASEVYDDTIYVMGGIYLGLTHNQVYAYSPQSNTWTQKGNMPDSKMSAESVTYGDDIYLFGGWWAFNPFDLPGAFSPQTWKFHPTTDTWENLGADLPDDEVVGFASALAEDEEGNICIYAI